ncbi:hypothetical protein ACFPYJ_02555 [Paenibacillus solisilvae]|uniref:Uncharacterized protein n=1 Tax=Paenibacillus solisilvae TaxID=2486751 RepID=A0ABW0VT16_9BACL
MTDQWIASVIDGGMTTLWVWIIIRTFKEFKKELRKIKGEDMTLPRIDRHNENLYNIRGGIYYGSAEEV